MIKRPVKADGKKLQYSDIYCALAKECLKQGKICVPRELQITYGSFRLRSIALLKKCCDFVTCEAKIISNAPWSGFTP